MEKLRNALLNEVVEITFEKADGTNRVAIATMLPEFLPTPKETLNPSMSRPVPNENILFWDLEAQGFRSCKSERVLAWEIVYVD